MAQGETQLLIETDNTRSTKRLLRRKLQTALLNEFSEILKTLPPTEVSIAKFQQLLGDERLTQLEELVELMKTWDVATTIPEPKTFLYYSQLQPILAIMLEDINKYRAYLEPFIVRFAAENECIVPKHKSNTPETFNGPIHYAVDQLNADFLEWLLARPATDTNLRNNFKQTALMILCERHHKYMNKPNQTNGAEELKNVRALIIRLLQAGADFNICSTRLKLAFDLLLKHRDTDPETAAFIDQCVDLSQCALATCGMNNRNKLVVSFYKNNTAMCPTVELLEIFLRFNDRDKFFSHLDVFHIDENNVKKVIRLLLHTAFDQRLPDCIKRILKAGDRSIFKVVREIRRVKRRVDDKSGGPRHPVLQQNEVEQSSSELVHRVELKGLLKKACHLADLGILKHLVSHISDLLVLNEDPLLALTLTKAYDCKRRIEDRNALLACAEFLASQYTIYISKADNSGNTPLHLALKFGFEPIALMLLKQSYAFLGLRNRDNRTPLDYGRYEFWKSYLDHCIEVDERRSAQDRTLLRFNLNALEPPPPSKTTQPSQARDDGWQLVQRAGQGSNRPRRFAHTMTEMTTLRQIAQSSELKRLLIHPVLYTFVMVKWTRLRHWNFLNLALTLLTVISFGGYSLTACSTDGPNPWLKGLSIVGGLFVIARELLQMLFLRKSYISFENVVDIANVVAMGMVLTQGCMGLLSSFVVISFTMELTFLFYSLNFNSLATMTHMFHTVTKNFLRSILLFLPLIGAFTYAFHLTYNQQSHGDPPLNVCTENDCAEGSFNNFSTFWSAAIKTIVMTTGEFDAASIDFNNGKVLLFIVFLFFAPIVILNLINGLAVSDITAIREESELISIGKKVTMLERYERGVANVRPAWLQRYFPKPFFAEHTCRIHVNTREYCKIEVHRREPVVRPGHGVDSGFANVRGCSRTLSKCPWLPSCDWSDVILNFRIFRFTLFVRLDKSILHDALAIVENRQPIVTSITPNSTPTGTDVFGVPPLDQAVQRTGRAGSGQSNDATALGDLRQELQELRDQLRALLKQQEKPKVKRRKPVKLVRKKVRKSLRKRTDTGDQ